MMKKNQITSPLINFDEQSYLKSNPDVEKAIIEGQVISGLSHYLSYGYYENRKGGLIEIDQKIKNLLDNKKEGIVPPPNLRIRVQQAEDIFIYKTIGSMVTFDMHSAIESYGVDLGQNSRILDFGCGCGRVVRWLNYLYEDCNFYGTDIDEEAILWCQNNISSIGYFTVNKNDPPFTYPADYFNCIYSISVFTHLPEDMQFSWLEELHRVTKDDGLLLLSVHGEQLFPKDQPIFKQQFIENGFFYSVDQQGTDGLPDFYQTTFHTEPYIRSEWSKYFKIVDIIKKGVANNQDLVVCRKI